jgi:hypothetical protein
MSGGFHCRRWLDPDREREPDRLVGAQEKEYRRRASPGEAMIFRQWRPRDLVAGLVILLVGVSCAKKEQPATPPPTSLAPSAAPVTTLPPPTTVPTPPPVWRAARWGMTTEEVLAAFPGEAQKLASPAPLTQPQPGSSLKPGVGEVAIPAYEADGATFRVLFAFESKALDRIELAAVKPGAATCEDVEKALTERHGEPARRASTGSSLRGSELTWKRPDQTIVLSCAGVASLGFLTVTVDYLPPPTETAGK